MGDRFDEVLEPVDYIGAGGGGEGCDCWGGRGRGGLDRRGLGGPRGSMLLLTRVVEEV